MSLSAHAGSKPFVLTNKKRIVLALRLLILSLLILIAVFNRKVEHVPVQVYLFLGVYVITMLALAFLDLKNFLSTRASTWIFVFDVLVTLLTSFYLGQKNPEFYFVYLVAVLAAAAGKNIGVVFATSILVSLIYGVFCHLGRTGIPLFSPTFFVHIILFYIMAIFSTYLIHEAELERQEKEAAQYQLTTRVANLSEYLENVLQSINMGILIMDNDGKITTLNRRARDILNLQAQDLWNRRIIDVPDLSAFIPSLKHTDTVRIANPASRREFDYMRADGNRVTLGFSLAKLKDRTGGAAGTICCFQDITLIREVERRMAQQERVATVAQLASGIAHEFYNLLGGVQGLLDTALKEEDPREVRDTITLSSQTIKRSFHLIQNLLSFSREQAPSRKLCRLKDILEETLTLVQHELKQGRVEVIKEYRDDPEILADPHQLGQVFMNMIINARHAMSGPGQLRISVNARDHLVTVSFSDTGCGISPENLLKIFEPFYTTKGALGGTKIPGTGLGLTVSRAIIEKHGGTITVTSTPGKGSTFMIQLPIKAE